MRFPQAASLVLLTILLTLAVQSRIGCNTAAPAHPSSRNESRERTRPQTSRGQDATTDAVRFDDTLLTHYAPEENLERIDTDLLATAKQRLDVAAYSLTDFALRDALIAAAGRGVNIRIYVDKAQSAGEEKRDDSVLQALAATPHITVSVKHSGVLMHLKSYVVDGTVLRSGSANFSPTGEKRQDNDLTLTRNPVAVHAFEQHFADMWSRPDNDPLH